MCIFYLGWGSGGLVLVKEAAFHNTYEVGFVFLFLRTKEKECGSFVSFQVLFAKRTVTSKVHSSKLFVGNSMPSGGSNPFNEIFLPLTLKMSPGLGSVIIDL